MSVKVTELGCAGHFICADRCRWRRHTQIGNKFRVSSVGDYYPKGTNGKRETLGSGISFFESMVFHTDGGLCTENEGCGCLEVTEYIEIEGRRYVTAGEAQAGHEDLVSKYLAIAESEAS